MNHNYSVLVRDQGGNPHPIHVKDQPNEILARIAALGYIRRLEIVAGFEIPVQVVSVVCIECAKGN